MPHRLTSLTTILLGAAGLAVVTALFLMRRNVRHAADNGPKWKRRLVTAALTLAGGIGLAGCGGEGPTTTGEQPAEDGPEPTTVVTPRVSPAATETDTLSERAEWQALTETWRQAEEIASQEIFSYPFTVAEKQKLLADLHAAGQDVATLHAQGLLTELEAGLLAMELERLTDSVRSYRATSDDDTRIYPTCYVTFFPIPAEVSLQQLTQRLDLLAEFAGDDTLQEAVTLKLLPAIQADIDILNTEEEFARINNSRRAEAAEVLQAAQAAVERITGTQPPVTLEASTQWQALTETWRRAEEIAANEPYAYPFTEAEQDALLSDLQTSSDDVDDLLTAGLLTEPEAGLLKLELTRLTDSVNAFRPVEMEMATCYEPMMVIPAADALHRLEQRLDLLKALADDGAVNKGVVLRLLTAVQVDLDTLAVEELLGHLSDDQRVEAERVSSQAKAAINQIWRFLIPATRTCYDVQIVDPPDDDGANRMKRLEQQLAALADIVDRGILSQETGETILRTIHDELGRTEEGREA